MSVLDIAPRDKYNLVKENCERSQIMKKIIRIILPIFLALVIIACTCWYLFDYDKEFTRDMLLSFARFSESQGSHSVATWLYNQAYAQAGDNDAVACELAEQYISSGNYTKAEFTLSNAIADGGGIDIYIALCKTYVEQDKLLDAVNMLNNITNEEIKQQLDALRPEAPISVPEPGFYSQYISVTLGSEGDEIYASTDGEYPSVQGDSYVDPIALTDGENTIYALAISDDGLVSPLSIFAYTVGGVVQEMDFADSAIEASVRKLLSVDEKEKLFTNDLWTIKEFTVPKNAKSYADLKHMTFVEKLTITKGVSDELNNISYLSNLKELTIKDTTVTQGVLETIAALPLLSKLTLADCGIAGITPLKNAVDLEYLDLNNNTIRTIDAISAMTKLQELNLSHNAITSLKALSSNTALTTLNLASNDISSLAALSSLTGLKTIDASTNKITKLGEIGKLTALTTLSLKNNKLKSIDDLSGCLALTDLNIASNELAKISAVAKLKKLMYFDCSYNKITDLPDFSKDCELVTINASNNKISSLEMLSGLKQLNNVNMDYNEEISSVSALANCPKLIEVNVYGTKVTSVSSLTEQSVIVNYNPTN